MTYESIISIRMLCSVSYCFIAALGLTFVIVVELSRCSWLDSCRMEGTRLLVRWLARGMVWLGARGLVICVAAFAFRLLRGQFDSFGVVGSLRTAWEFGELTVTVIELRCCSKAWREGTSAAGIGTAKSGAKTG